MPLAGRRPAQRAVASAAALALALLGSGTGSPAGAQTIDIVGPVVTLPGGVPLPAAGTPSASLGAAQLHVGNGGSFAALAGARFEAGAFRLGAPVGTGAALLRADGPGTAVQASGSDWFRLIIGHDSAGWLEVTGDALFDAGGNAAACTAAGSWCGTLLGFGAGSQAALLIDGAGSELRSPLGFVAGNAQPMSLSSATTTASITVGNGGSLRTGSASICAWASWPGRSVAAATSPAAARIGSLRCRYPSLRHGR